MVQVALNSLRQGLPRVLPEPERSSNGGGHELGIGYGGEGDEEHTIVELLQEIGTSLKGEAGLAGASRAREREEAHLLAAKPLCYLLDLALPAHQRGGLQGQVVGVAFEGPKGRKLRRQTRPHELEEPLRPEEVLQAPLPQVPQLYVGRQLVACELFGRQR